MLPQVNLERLEALMKAQEVVYDRLDECIVVHFENSYFIIAPGEFALQNEGTWRGDLVEEADLQAALQYCAQRNTNVYFPKCYVKWPDGENAGSLCCEVNMPLGEGFSDEQLKDFFYSSISSMLAVFREADEMFNHLVTWESE